MRSPKTQSGMSIMALLFGAFLLIFAAYLAMKLVPAYMTNMTIGKLMDDVAVQAANEKLTHREIKVRLSDRLGIDGVPMDIINPHEQLVILKENGESELRLDYDRMIPISGNLSALIQFENSSYY